MKSTKQQKSKLTQCIACCLVASVAMNVMCIRKNYKTQNTLEETELQLNNKIEVLESKLSVYDTDYVVPSQSPPRYLDVPLSDELQEHIWLLCSIYDITEHYELIYALIRHESNFNESIISATNDYGLMQINVVNHGYLREKLGLNNFLDPYQNIHAGIYLLAPLLHKYDTSDALMSYNMGEFGASKFWECGTHTTQYTESVMKYYAIYK